MTTHKLTGPMNFWSHSKWKDNYFLDQYPPRDTDTPVPCSWVRRELHIFKGHLLVKQVWIDGGGVSVSNLFPK